MITKRPSGFTLVELVAVVVLIGIVCVVVAPSFFDIDAYAERGYADEVKAALRYSQRVAISSGCDVQFTITPAGYSSFQRAPAGVTCAAGGPFVSAVLRSDGLAVAGNTPSAIAVAANSVTVFNSRGEPNAAPPAIVIGPNTISVAATTGRVSSVP
jgi:MSHA pilin protein MshC